MTATTRPVPLGAALRRASRAYTKVDAHRDRATMLATVAQMHANGAENQQIADRIGQSRRHISRLLTEAPPTPAPLSTFDTSATRCRRLEDTAAVAADLACRLRDDDPRIAWDALGRLDRVALQELAVVLLAAMPVDQSMSDTFGWVLEMNVAVVNA